LTGFERIVFKGTILHLVYPGSVNNFLRRRGITNTGSKDWILHNTAELIKSVEAYTESRNIKVVQFN